jgi:hypothetical protein
MWTALGLGKMLIFLDKLKVKGNPKREILGFLINKGIGF